MRSRRAPIGSGLRRVSAAGLLVAGSVVMLATMSLAGSAAAGPKGNNGTIKIDGVALQGGQANEPHVACQFALEFYGYEQGDLNASVIFELQPPTTRASGSQVLLTDTVPIGGDPAGGGTDLDASKLYTLDFNGVTPHANQGVPREGDRPRRRVAGGRHQAQGVLGRALRDDDHHHDHGAQYHHDHDRRDDNEQRSRLPDHRDDRGGPPAAADDGDHGPHCGAR